MKSMNKKVLAVVIGTIAIAGISLIAIVASPGWNLTWNVEEGNNLKYNILSDDKFIGFNNTVLLANITHLPDLSIIKTPDTFVASVLDISKVIIFHENGSEVLNYEQTFRLLISYFILPCGDWEVLDNLYPSPEDAYFGPSGSLSGHTSELENDYFFLSYERVDVDSSTGWNAKITLDTGVPFYIQYWRYDHFPDTPDYIDVEFRILIEMFLET